MDTQLNRSGFQAESDIHGEDDEDTKLLREMAAEARDYVGSFEWAPPLTRLSLARGAGGIIGIFLAEFDRKIDDIDDALWLVVGDLPSAYLVVNEHDSPAQALNEYLALMEEWARAARAGDSVEECFPVDAEPTVENAEALLSRIAAIRLDIIPYLFGSN
jgi:hypothetical protein